MKLRAAREPTAQSRGMYWSIWRCSLLCCCMSLGTRWRAAKWGYGKPDCAMASGWSCVRQSTATAGRNALEHSGRTPGKRGAATAVDSSGCGEQLDGWEQAIPTPISFCRRCCGLMCRCWSLICCQSILGWRPDSALIALVCAGTGPQPNGDDDSRLAWHCGVRRRCLVDAFRMACCDLCFHVDELLERFAARAGADTHGQAAAP